MKKYITTSLFIFWALTVAVITAGLVTSNINQSISPAVINSGSNNGSVGQINNTNTGSNSTITKNGLALTMVELAKHNSAQSCWLLISGKIYDVTTYLNQHPGNASTILPTCGTDATSAYDTKGSKGIPHSSNATALLVNYFIGNLNQNIKTSSNTSVNGNLANVVTATKTTTVQNSSQTPVSVIPVVTQNTTLTLSSTELVKHNSAQSCWLLISGKIYDVTNYLNQHPAGANIILQTCGTDATAAYGTRGGTGSHSSSADAMLGAYYIGNLDQTVVTNTTNPTSIPAPTPTVTSRQNRENDED